MSARLPASPLASLFKRSTKAQLGKEPLSAWLVPFLCFFLSGASGLVFEVIWTRKLALVFGASTPAISTVLTAFMGGLAFGSYALGRRADKLRFPILTYAVMEAGVGLFALLVPLIIDRAYPPISRVITNHGGNSFDLFTFLRFLVVALVLLPPTTLMGATLPLLAKHFVRQGGGLGQRVGALYAVNTFGAVAGTFFAGFVLLPYVGLAWTNALAGLTNVTLAVLIVVFRKTLLGNAWPKSLREISPWAEPDTASTAPDKSRAGMAEGTIPQNDRKDAERSEPKAGAQPEVPTMGPRENKKKRKPAQGPISPDDDSRPYKATHVATVSNETPLTREEDLIDEPFSSSVRYAALATACGSGFAAMAYEVILSRALDMVIGSSVYSFTIILMAFLVGIAGGSALCSAILKARPSLMASVGVGACFVFVGLLAYLVFRTRVSLMLFVITALMVTLCVTVASTWRRPALALGAVQLLIGVGAACTYYFQDKIPRMFLYLAMVTTGACEGDGTVRFSQHVGTIQAMSFLVAALCALPAAIGMGASFPLALRAFSRNAESVGGDTGKIYSINTIGSIAGSFLTGFVIMPALGMETAFYIAVAVNLALALTLMLVAPGDEPAKYVLVPITAIMLAIAATGSVLGRDGRLQRSQSRFALFPRPWNQERMTMGVFRLSLADGMISRRNHQCIESEETEGIPGDDNPIFYRDGVTTTVTVERWSLGDHTQFSLKNNGKVDASNGADMPTQILVAGYPLLVHPRGPDNLDVAIIGWGSGVTVGTALQFPLRRLDVIELERATLDASRYFAEVNHLQYNLREFPYVSMPRLNVINNDGRNYLASTDRRYDVVIAEPSNPWITGVSNLFTVDHYRAAAQSLAPGGIYLQWVQLYEMNPNNIKTLYRTFTEVFPYVRVFSADANSSDTIMLGSFSPIPLDPTRIQQVLERDARIRAALEPAHITTAYDLLARMLFSSRDEVRRFAVIEEHLSQGNWTVDLRANGTGECTLPLCRRRPAPINTDDNALIEFAAPRDLIGFDAFAGYLDALYGDDWPYGRVENELAPEPDAARRASRLADLGLALLAAGRPARAGEVIDTAAAIRGPEGQPMQTPELARAIRIWTATTSPRGEPALRLETPRPGPDISREGERRLLEVFQRATQAAVAQQWRTALASFADLPASVRNHSGPSLRMFYAYLLYRASMLPDAEPRFQEAAEQFEQLERDEPEWTRRHPELLYFIARTRFRSGDFGLAVAAMLRFDALASAHLARDHEAIEVVRDVDEPPIEIAPVSDAAGESNKDRH